MLSRKLFLLDQRSKDGHDDGGGGEGERAGGLVARGDLPRGGTVDAAGADGVGLVVDDGGGADAALAVPSGHAVSVVVSGAVVELGGVPAALRVAIIATSTNVAQE